MNSKKYISDISGKKYFATKFIRIISQKIYLLEMNLISLKKLFIYYKQRFHCFRSFFEYKK